MPFMFYDFKMACSINQAKLIMYLYQIYDFWFAICNSMHDFLILKIANYMS